MAIKVKLKKKDEGGEDDASNTSPELLDAEGEGTESGPAPAGSQALDDLLERDLFLETADSSIGWASRNQKLLIGVFAVAAIIIVGGILWNNQSKTANAELSGALTAAVDVLQAPIEGQEPPAPAGAAPKADKLKYKTAQEKFQALDAKVSEVEKSLQGGSAGTAELLKARAAMGLGKADDAIGIYQGWLGRNPNGPERPFVLQALAEAQAQAGKPDEAATTLGQLKAVNEKAWGEYAAYQTAVAYDTADNKEKAKASYETFVKGYPESDRVQQARMRLDLL